MTDKIRKSIDSVLDGSVWGQISGHFQIHMIKHRGPKCLRCSTANMTSVMTVKSNDGHLFDKKFGLVHYR